MKKKIKIIIIGIIVLLLVVLCAFLYIKVLRPYNIAVKNYKEVVKVINNKNAELDKSIKNIQKLIDSNENVIDKNVITTAKKVTKNAEANKLVVGKMPTTTSEINKKTKKLSVPPDYSKELSELLEAYNTYVISIKQYKQLTNPKEKFVIQRLQTIDEIVDVRAVTEDNDPNGKLNKSGGYTSTVYFESKNVNQNEVYGTDLIDKGTSAGGSIEVYVTEKDAISRRDYLAGFDGGILSTGTHTVVGTVLIRTSDKLTASKQKALEDKIIVALSSLK